MLLSYFYLICALSPLNFNFILSHGICRSLRTKPTDPAYDIDSVSFKDKESKEFIIITPENFEDLKNKIFEQSSIIMKTKVSCRPASPLKGRGRRDSQNNNDENNAPNNFSNTASPCKSVHSPLSTLPLYFATVLHPSLYLYLYLSLYL
jgi:hypothetical protein